MMQGDLVEAIELQRELTADAEAAHDLYNWTAGHLYLAIAMAFHGDTSTAEAAARTSLRSASENLSDPYLEGISYANLALTAVIAGDGAAAADASEAAWARLSRFPQSATVYSYTFANAALARGDLVEARRWADAGVAGVRGWYLLMALIGRARVAIAEGAPEQAENDASEALACAAATGAHNGLFEILEILANITCQHGRHAEGVRLFGAAEAVREHTGAVRMKIHDADYAASVAAVRKSLGEADFDAAWAEGKALSTGDAIAYAQRGRGERKRPASGWASLTPAELDVVRLVSEGLTNKAIAARLFVSPRTVETHLTHIYGKLGVTSRLQLARQATQHA
jgi:DNA-binding CsgD family transcriptional regulator